MGAVFTALSVGCINTLKLSNMKPSYSELTLPGIRAVKAEHKAWRLEKMLWLAILLMIPMGSALLLNALKQTL